MPSACNTRYTKTGKSPNESDSSRRRAELALASLSELIGPLSHERGELPADFADALMSLVPQKADDRVAA
ncbi:hypothetical protein ACWGLE_04670 [Streptomyces sp. NPDC055897]